MEEEEKRPGPRSVLQRARDTLLRAGAGGAERLRGTTHRVAEALGSAAERLKETPAGEKLGAVVETRRVLKRAAEARARGNLPMAYRLLEAELHERPGDARVALAFWETAQACERAGDAAEGLLVSVRKLAAGKAEEAAQLWSEMVGVLPDLRADAGSLVRMVPALLEREEAPLAVRALQHALDPQASGLTPGLAVRVAEYARVLDPPTALRAARVALDAPDLHEARRRALHQLVAELERDAAQPSPSRGAAPGERKQPIGEIAPMSPRRRPTPPRPAPPAKPSRPIEREPEGPEEPFAELVVQPTLESLAPATRFPGVKAMRSVPIGFAEESLELSVSNDRRARLEYAKIQAIAVAEVLELGPGIVIDLALNWNDDDGGPLRLVRLRSSEFDAAAVVGGSAQGASALRAFATRLLDRSGAVPLPDVDAVLGDSVRIFESLAAYEHEVLMAHSGAAEGASQE